MKRRVPAFHAKLLLVCLIAVLLAVSAIARPAEAMFVPAAPQTRAADLARIQKALESSTLQQRLKDYGLSPEKALAKINGLSDEQVHWFAANIDALQPGGHRGDGVIIILLLIILILIII
jgi:hypothetical protein